MKRKTKNIVMITILLLFIMLNIFTLWHAKNNDKNVVTRMEEKRELPNEIPNDRERSEMEGEPPQKPEENQQENHTIKNTTHKLSTVYYVAFCIEDFLIAILIIYLCMSHFNKKTWKETLFTADKALILILSTTLLTILLIFGNKMIIESWKENSKMKEPETAEKDEVKLNKDGIVESGKIDLSNYDQDITIKSAGTYTFSGNFEHAIIVEASSDDEIVIELDNVNITNKETATIIGLSGKELLIKTIKDSKNYLTDGGNSEYDACIYSEIPLIFDGEGVLKVIGNQNEGEGIATEAQDLTFENGIYHITSADDGLNAGGEGATITINGGNLYIDANGDGIDSNKNAVINGGTIFVMGSDVGGDAGIDTDAGYTINGGSVIALGSDMVETPLESSHQKSIAFTLSSAIAKNTLITLMKENEVIVSFEASKSFKTIIISSSSLEDGDYSLYQGGTHTGELQNGICQNGKYEPGTKIKINNEDSFTISKTVNLFGNKR